jgi:hypothetical protein
MLVYVVAVWQNKTNDEYMPNHDDQDVLGELKATILGQPLTVTELPLHRLNI